MKAIQILCINDYHAQLRETNTAPGCAKLVTAVREYCEGHPNTFVVFGGDNHRGDPICDFCAGHPVTELMRYLHTKASALGNHELETPTKDLFSWEVEGCYQYLAANLIDKTNGEIPAFARPYQMLESNGILIAILGLSGVEQLSTSTHPPEMRQMHITDGIEAAKYWIRFLQNGGDPQGKPNAIIALTHYGLAYDATQGLVGNEMLSLCQSGLGINGAFAAHWHQFMAVNIDGVAVAQGGAKGEGFAILNLKFDAAGTLQKVVPSFVKLADRLNDLLPDSQMAAAFNEANTKGMRVLGDVIGFSDSPMPHRDPQSNEPFYRGSRLSSLVLQSMLNASDCKIGLMSSGWIGAGLPSGPISRYDILQTIRFNGNIVKMEVRGSELLKNISIGIRNLRSDRLPPIAVMGLQLEIAPEHQPGSRLISAALTDGRMVEPSNIYEIVTDSDIAENMLGFNFENALSKSYLNISLRDCVEVQIKKVQTLNIPEPSNIKIV